MTVSKIILLCLLGLSFLLVLYLHIFIFKAREKNKQGPIFTYGVDGQKYVRALRVPFFKSIFTFVFASSFILSILAGGAFLLLCLDWLMEKPIFLPENSISTFLATQIPSFILWTYLGIVLIIAIGQSLLIFFRWDYFSPYKIQISKTSLELTRTLLFWKKSILVIDFSKPYEHSVNQDIKSLNNDRISYCFSQNEKGIALSFPKVSDNTNDPQKSVFFSESFLNTKVFYVLEPHREFSKIKSLVLF